MFKKLSNNSIHKILSFQSIDEAMEQDDLISFKILSQDTKPSNNKLFDKALSYNAKKIIKYMVNNMKLEGKDDFIQFSIYYILEEEYDTDILIFLLNNKFKPDSLDIKWIIENFDDEEQMKELITILYKYKVNLDYAISDAKDNDLSEDFIKFLVKLGAKINYLEDVEPDFEEDLSDNKYDYYIKKYPNHVNYIFTRLIDITDEESSFFADDSIIKDFHKKGLDINKKVEKSSNDWMNGI